MKFLDNPDLEYINSLFNGLHVRNEFIRGRLESYSCKMTQQDKKLFRSVEKEYADTVARSPTGFSPLGQSPIGDLNDTQTRKKLVNLIATLNAAYPDYDFSDVKAESFTWKPGAEYCHMVKNSIMTTLAEVDTHLENSNMSMTQTLWAHIEAEIAPLDCDIYSYIPDMDSDPLSDGKLWSFNYFFYNPKMKKVLFFTCSSTRKGSPYLTGKQTMSDGEPEDEMFNLDDDPMDGHEDDSMQWH